MSGPFDDYAERMSERGMRADDLDGDGAPEFSVDEVRCYLCHLNATDVPDNTPDSRHSPLRRVVGERTVNRADPTAAYLLSCGHTVI